MNPAFHLITVAEVARANLRSSKSFEDLSIESTEFYEECLEVIEDTTSDIESVLNRKLIVRPRTFPLTYPSSWCLGEGYFGPDDYTFYTYKPREWPYLETISINEETGDGDIVLSDLSILDNGNLVGYSSNASIVDFPYQLKAYAGYRRKDQTVGLAEGSGTEIYCGGSGEPECLDLNTVAGLEDLSTMPPILPGRIRRVAIRLVTSELREQIRGLVGLIRTTQRIDAQVIESQTVDPEEKYRVLADLKARFGYYNT